ncbi:MAG: hypothetical protein SFV24_22065 [Gemmatimonadales bacterium]|nr:hypothetical protein [Gemmatimonadales bacterium]
MGLLILGLGKIVGAWAIARGPGPEVQGGFGLALACMSFGGIVLALGFDYANAYVVGRQPELLASVIANSILVACFALVVGPIWSAGFVALFPKTVPVGADLPWSVAAIGVGTAVTILGQSVQSAAIGAQDLAGVARANAFTGIAWAMFMLTAGQGLGFVGLLTGWLAVVGLAAAYLIGRLRSKMGPVRGFRRSTFGAQVRFGVRTVPGGVARALNLRAPLYWSSREVSAADLGVLVMYLNIAEALLYLPNALGQVFLSWSARHGTASPSSKAAYAVMASVGVAAAAGVALLGRTILAATIGEPYGANSTVLSVLLLATTAHSLGLLRVHTLMGLGNPWVTSVGQIVALCVGTALAVLLAPRYGLLGLGLAMLFGYMSFTAVLFAAGRQRPSVRAASELSK